MPDVAQEDARPLRSAAGRVGPGRRREIAGDGGAVRALRHRQRHRRHVRVGVRDLPVFVSAEPVDRETQVGGPHMRYRHREANGEIVVARRHLAVVACPPDAHGAIVVLRSGNVPPGAGAAPDASHIGDVRSRNGRPGHVLPALRSDLDLVVPPVPAASDAARAHRASIAAGDADAGRVLRAVGGVGAGVGAGVPRFPLGPDQHGVVVDVAMGGRRRRRQSQPAAGRRRDGQHQQPCAHRRAAPAHLSALQARGLNPAPPPPPNSSRLSKARTVRPMPRMARPLSTQATMHRMFLPSATGSRSPAAARAKPTPLSSTSQAVDSDERSISRRRPRPR